MVAAPPVRGGRLYVCGLSGPFGTNCDHLDSIVFTFTRGSACLSPSSSDKCDYFYFPEDYYVNPEMFCGSEYLSA